MADIEHFDWTDPDTDDDRSADVDVDNDPRSEDPDNNNWREWNQLTRPERVAEWRRQLEAHGSENAVIDARRVARSARRAPRVKRSQYQSAFGIYAGFPRRDVVVYERLLPDGTPDTTSEQIVYSIDPIEFHAIGPPDADGKRTAGYEKIPEAAKETAWQQAIYEQIDEPLGGTMRRERTLVGAEQLASATSSTSTANNQGGGGQGGGNHAGGQGGNPGQPFGGMQVQGGLQNATTCCTREVKIGSGIAVAVVLVGAVSVGAWQLIEHFNKPPSPTNPTNPPSPVAKPVARPIDVAAVFTANSATAKNDIAVSWSAPAPDTTTEPAATWTVQLLPDGGEPGEEIPTDVTSYVIADVPDGDYHVRVTGIALDGRASQHVDSAIVTVKTSPVTPPDGSVPGEPRTVELVETWSPLTGNRGLTVAWSPPTDVANVTGYRVLLEETTGSSFTAAPLDVAVPINQQRWDNNRIGGTWALPKGSWRATVHALNGAKQSPNGIASSLVQFDPMPPNAPGAPSTVTPSVRVGRTNTPNVRVDWDAVVGAESYLIGISDRLGNRVRNTSDDVATRNTRVTLHAIPDGTWNITVRARNAAGVGPATTVPVTVDHTSDTLNGIDGLDWTTVVSPDDVAKWQALMAPLNTMQEDAFWTMIRGDMVADGAPLSWVNQLLMARLLTTWIHAPANPPRATQLADLATSLRTGAALPALPNPDQAPDLSLWTSAEPLQTALGQPVPLRWKLFTIVRVIEELLDLPTSRPQV